MLLRIAFVVVLSTAALAQTASHTPMVERVDDTAFIQLQSPSFEGLDARQKALAYWLTQASIAIDPVIYDQLSAYGIREKRLFEEIMSHTAGIPAGALGKIREFSLLFWANRGNHNENTGLKFLPTFTFEELKAAATTAQSNGAFKTGYADLPALSTADTLSRELDSLRAPLFDPQVEPIITAKTPPAGKDIIQDRK